MHSALPVPPDDASRPRVSPRPSTDGPGAAADPAGLLDLTGAMPQAAWVMDGDGRLVFANPPWHRAFSHTAVERARHGDWSAIVHPDDTAAVRAALVQAAVLPAAFQRDLRLRHADGAYRWHQVHVTPVFDAHGRLAHWFGVDTDIHERKLAEEALRRSEERFRALVEATSLMVWSTDAAGRVIEDSPSFRLFTGQAPAAYLGAGWLDAVHPDDRARTLAHWQACRRTRAPYRLDLRLRRHDGTYRWFSVHGVPLLDEQGQVREWVGTNTDITERRQAEEQLRRSEAEFRSIADAAPAITWTTDAAGQTTYMSRTWRETTGQSTLDGVGLGWTQAVHPDDRSGAGAAFRAASDRREPFSAQYRLRQIDGSHRWVLDVGRPRFSATGDFLGYVGNVLDVHDRHLAEQALRGRERMLDVVYQTAPIGMWLGDRDCRFLRVNEMLAEANGYPVAAHIGKTVRELVPRVADVIEPYYRRVLETGRPVLDFEVTGETPARPGVTRTWLVSYYPVFDDAGEVEAVSGVAYEVTELRRAQQALIEADRRKDEFLATLAHELRNPLAPIRTGMKLLERLPADSPKGHATLAMMQRQMAHMTRLVDDLLDVSRISHGKVELRRERVMLSDVLKAAIDAARPNIEAGGHAFDCHLPADVVYLDADPARLSQVVANLLNNAAKYTPAGGHVLLRAWAESGTLAIAVRDDGLGIAPEMLPRVFDLFTQAEQTLDRAQGGLGIGLSLVRQLVGLHGGSVQAESAGPGQGATFTVRLLLPAMRRPPG